MKNFVEIAKAILVCAVSIALVLGVIYVTQVMPYDNDWTCLIAECRKVY